MFNDGKIKCLELVLVKEREFCKKLHEQGKFIKKVMNDGVPLYGLVLCEL